jgi:hypothetical protein
MIQGGPEQRPDGLTRSAKRAGNLHRLLARLGTPIARRVVIVLALALVAPSIVGGFAFDDYILLDELSHRDHDFWPGRAPLDLFRWLDPAHVHRLVDGEGLAFWTFDRTTNAYLRPITSLTHTIDGLLWPRSAEAMHLHSLIWFALLLVLVTKLYSELLENRFVVGVASAMFALDSAHGVAVGWISNRNALVGGAFGAAALLLYHRFRRGEGARFGVLAWLCAACSVFSAELAVGLLGYVLGYALLYEQGPLRRRLLSLLPYAALLALFAIVRVVGHYGVYGLGAYIDPLHEPGAFLASLPERVLVLLSSQVSRLNADLFEYASAATRPLYCAAALLACAAFVACLWPSLRTRREARFLGAGAVLSALPLAAGSPSDRLLTFVGVGAMPLLAIALEGALVAFERGTARALRDRVRNLGALAFGLVHLTLDPLLLPMFTLSPATNARTIDALDASLPKDAAISGKTVIVTEVPDSVLLTYLPAMRAFKGESPLGKLYWLVGNATPVELERRDETTLRVSTRSGFFSDAWEERASRLPLHAGQRIELSEMSVAVVKVTRDGRPLVCDFMFRRPLEASEFVWLRFTGDQLQPTQPPRLAHEIVSANLGP